MQAIEAPTSLMLQWKLPEAAAPHNTPQIRGIQVTGFRTVDGKGIGVVVELSGGQIAWFFDDELTLA